MKYVLTAKDAHHDFQRWGGGKATNMARMETLGVPVPPWLCLSTRAFDRFIEKNRLYDRLSPTEDLAAFEAYVENLFLSFPLPEEVGSAVCEALGRMNLSDVFLAVRSSGNDEDSAAHSFAGQYSSFLYQKGFQRLSESIRKCWASGFSERAIAYRQKHGLPMDSIKVAVILQQMIDADTAGVAFSRNPIHPLDREHVVIDAVYGLGEGLVSGRLDADHYEVHRDTKEVGRHIVNKDEAYRQAEEGGVVLEPVAVDLQEQPALTEEQARTIAKTLITLEDSLGAPQDCEWAYDSAGELFFLQTRPITNLPPAAFYDPEVNGQDAVLWDNSNIIESYSGVTSPLTFSFASNAYREVYVQFCRIMGVPRRTIEEHETMFRNMLGLIRGRFYYNLINWYRLIQMLPGAGSSASFMETMMGVKQELKPELAHLFEFMEHPPRYSMFRRLKVHGMTLWRFFRMPRIMDAFSRRFDRVYDKSRALDFEAMPLPALLRHYQFLQDELLKHWQAPIINDYLCMIFFGLLKKFTEKWVTEGEENAALQNDLLCGEGDLESTEPTKMLMRIAEHIDQSDATLREWLLGAPAEEVWIKLTETGYAPELKEQLDTFLDKYGFRCVDELKLEEKDLHDDPSFALSAIASYVRTGSYDVASMEAREREIRLKAESVVFGRLSGLRKAVYVWILKHTRRAVKNRENLRFARTRIFGIARHLFRGAGRQLVRLGLLETDDDVFYLTVDELTAFVDGRPGTIDLKSLAQLRKIEFEGYRSSLPPPDRFLTYGAVGASIAQPQVLADADLLRSEVAGSDDPNVLIGTPCCPGIVEGVVRVANTSKDAQGLDREILVTARTDPGWVPLFPSCSGLLIERGSLLSHSAVVARELGLPTIVGISGGLMEKLETGRRVRMDGGKGEVRVI